ncbi:hypothetical protein PIB30_069281 [Stylosanthes scabra]|uniref:Uncharacterized protein n=1 Tax=Stylosanthes scabra TaxID=79078 RepID=A0ABU6XLM0_9FABA|nr:hypothetical protein [Stylosanthes scabra]
MENEDNVDIKFEAMLEKAQPLFSTESCCIYKVPHQIRQSNEDAYTPMLVSIGPLHRGNPRLLNMERQKQVYCKNFIKRTWASLSDLMSCVRELEPKIRECYSEKIDLTADEFMKMILVDCAFVIELFLRTYEGTTKDDVIWSKSWVWNLVYDDLKLLENQVPIFVFEKLYNLAFPYRLSKAGRLCTVMWLAVSYFSYFNQQGLLPPAASSSIAHFTDLLRYFYLPPSYRRPSRNGKPQLAVIGHSASELVEAGVKFLENKKWHGGIGILDLEFEHSILKIPHLLVEDNTELLLRNIVALEQCYYPQQHYIIDYVRFFAQLINSNKDADVLIKAGIFNSMVSGNDTSVAKLFRDVDKNLIVSVVNADYVQICNDLNAYYKHTWHTSMATLRRDYFTTRWKTAASIAGIVLLILTFIQTVCSILQLK